MKCDYCANRDIAAEKGIKTYKMTTAFESVHWVPSGQRVYMIETTTMTTTTTTATTTLYIYDSVSDMRAMFNHTFAGVCSLHARMWKWPKNAFVHIIFLSFSYETSLIWHCPNYQSINRNSMFSFFTDSLRIKSSRHTLHEMLKSIPFTLNIDCVESLLTRDNNSAYNFFICAPWTEPDKW